MVKFGYNIDTASVPPSLYIPAMQASHADAHLIMFGSGNFFLREGELATVRLIAGEVPNCKLIIRNYHPAEGNWVLYPSVAEYESYFTWIRLKLGDTLMQRVILDDPSNEPNLNGSDRLSAKAYVARSILLAKAAANAGVKLALCAFSVGQPHESLINSEYAPFWKAIAQYRQAISLHLYGLIPFEAGELIPYRAILDARTASHAMLGGKWPSDYQGWLIGRSYRIIQAFEALGLGLPEIYVTECLIDQISDMGMEIKEAWKAKYGIEKYQRDPRGVQSWENYLKEMYPELAFDEAVAKLLSHARHNILYSSAFKGACLFALNTQWGYPDGSNKEAGSNYADSQFTRFRATLLPAINAESLEDTPMPQLYPATFHSLKVSNVRASNDVNSAILYTLDTNVLPGQIAKEGETMLGSSFIGLAIEFEHPATMATVKGFVAKTANLVIEYAQASKQYRLSINGATQIVSEATWLDMIKYHELSAASLKTIQPE